MPVRLLLEPTADCASCAWVAIYDEFICLGRILKSFLFAFYLFCYASCKYHVVMSNLQKTNTNTINNIVITYKIARW